MANMEKMVKIPLAYQIVVDDVGWFNCNDERWNDGPSRTGMTRKHVKEDYLVLNEIGKRINQKINCPFVIGEWDKDNVLRGMEHTVYDCENWDMASKIDMDIAEECFEAAESSEYIEYALHGLMHGYWNGKHHVADQEYFIPRDDNFEGRYSNDLVAVPKDYFKSHIETFFKIYESWGFKKKIRSFTSPSGAYGEPEGMLALADTLKEFDIKYWANNWRDVKDICEILNGVTFVNKSRGNGIPWNAYDIDPSMLSDYDQTYFDGDLAPVRTIFAVHWPNFLRFNPLDNFEKVDEWVKFFKRQGEIFGVMISRDIAFCASQAVYKRFTKITYGDKKINLDFSGVDSCGAMDVGDTFYLSVRNSEQFDKAVGADVKIYETHTLFKTYEIKRKNGAKNVEISFK